jgi:hypothetical protein
MHPPKQHNVGEQRKNTTEEKKEEKPKRPRNEIPEDELRKLLHVDEPSQE